MNVRWLWADYFDPSLGLTPAEKRDVRRIVIRLRGARRRFMLAALPGLPLCFLGILYLAIDPMTLSSRGTSFVLEIARVVMIMLLPQVAGWILMQALVRRAWQPFIEFAMAVTRLEACGQCGYSLQGLEMNDDTRCPECGTTPASLRCTHCGCWIPWISFRPGLCVECGNERRTLENGQTQAKNRP